MVEKLSIEIDILDKTTVTVLICAVPPLPDQNMMRTFDYLTCPVRYLPLKNFYRKTTLPVKNKIVLKDIWNFVP